MGKSEVEVILSVIVADAAYYLVKAFVILGIFAVLDPLSYKVAEDTSEVLVSGVGNEAAAVGEHSHEACEHTEVGKRGHLCYHSVALIVEPPARAELDLAGSRCLLEVAEHSAEHVVILGIEGVEYGLGQTVVVFKIIHKRGELFCNGEVVY